jgi:hypothetical protein
VRTLRACLLDEPLPRLMAMADLWDAPIEATSADDVADALAAHILQRENLLAARESLPPDARDALNALIAARGRMPVAAFERRFGVIRPMGPGKLERERPWLSPINPAEKLWYHGFIFRAFDRTSGTPTEVTFVPGDLLEALKAEPMAPGEEFGGEPPPPHPSALDLRQSQLLDDVTTLLCYIRNHDVRAKPGGEWDSASRRAIAPMLRDADGVSGQEPQGRFAFLIHLIARLGWVRSEQNRLRLIPQPVAHWLQSAPDAQHDALFNAWLDDPEWNDLAHVAGLVLEMTHAWSNDPVHMRKAIVEMWRAWRSQVGERSSTVSDFINHVRALNPDFARPDGRYDTWHIRDARTGEFLHGFENWERVEGALIRHILEKPLRWLSGPQEEAGEPPPSPFHVTDDGQIIIERRLRYERFQLARVADWVETRPATYVYRISPRSLERARTQGIRIGRVVEFLEQNSGQALPAGLKRALTRWEERGTEVRLEPMAILRAPDGATMDALLRSPRVRRLVVERFAPNCVAIRQRDADEARATIIESGLLVDFG